jgi:hypothetical protein
VSRNAAGARSALRKGIEIDERTWTEIVTAAEMLGLPPTQVDALVA